MTTLTKIFGDSPKHHRITQKEKNKNDFSWYKTKIDLYDAGSFNSNSGFTGISETRKMQANYDLFNNIIDATEFKYICQPYGDAVGEMPATFTNRDIVSGKVKVLLGMESKRPFSWKLIAINREATTRKEKHQFGMMKEYVISEVMKPIVTEIRLKHEGELNGGSLNDEQKQQVLAQIDDEIQASTPEEVLHYMKREHQDPAEVLGNQLLNFSIKKNSIKSMFDDGWKHGLLSGLEIYWEGESNGHPKINEVNPLNFDYEKSPDVKFIEDGEWAATYYDMSPSKIVEMFSSELTDTEIDKIYDLSSGIGNNMADATFTFDGRKDNTVGTVRLFHINFKSLKKVGFLYYLNKNTGEVEMMVVNEGYRLNKKAGDINVEWEWIPEAHEGYKIGTDIYKRMRPVIGQFNDLDNIGECKLSYKGAAYDDTNSEITSLMDRMKAYQFYYDIIMYRIEMLMASDKGKILLMNLNMIPSSSGIDIKKFLYYIDSTKTGFLNPNEEGNRGGQSDIVNAAKEIDLSLASDIQKYIGLAEYIEKRCGDSVGITKAMEGQAGANEAVQNNQLNYTQSSYILEPYFTLHNQIKRNVLDAHSNTQKQVYSQPSFNQKKLNYVLDDLSFNVLTINSELLDNSTYGLFMSNSSKDWDAKQAVQQLSQAAMQNQKADLLDIVKVIRSESMTEAEEFLEVADEKANMRQAAAEKQAQMVEKQKIEQLNAFQEKEWKHEKEMVILKEEERRKTVIQQQAILSVGFNENPDLDNDGKLDVLEIANDGIDANILLRKQKLEEDKFNEEKRSNKVDEDNAKKKLKIEASKNKIK